MFSFTVHGVWLTLSSKKQVQELILININTNPSWTEYYDNGSTKTLPAVFPDLGEVYWDKHFHGICSCGTAITISLVENKQDSTKSSLESPSLEYCTDIFIPSPHWTK